MSDIAIIAENLSKSYLVGHQAAQREKHTSLRDVLARESRNFARKSIDLFQGKQIVQGDEVEEFWALQDVNFEVKRGEVLGIIGRNGAGKSTLLKILSRITEPTHGRVTLRGRVASLLEVGTGFHGELSGRENIYLNGAILGMTSSEIKSKFDEIVAFADVERFLDTPVKRYSSGMYVRLAFSIAAHLEPEILIIDEVLAVGDAEFQKKSLGKMHSVSVEENRTVLFVSHNLQAVQSLCDRAVLLDKGSVIVEGGPKDVVARHLAGAQSSTGTKIWTRETAPGNEEVRLIAVRVLTSEGEPTGILDSENDFYVELDFLAQKVPGNLCIGFDLTNSEGVVIFRTFQTDLPAERWPAINAGRNRWRCRIPKGLLNGGDLLVNPRIGIHNVSWLVHEDAVLQFRLNLGHGLSPLWERRNRPGLIAPILDWMPTVP